MIANRIRLLVGVLLCCVETTGSLAAGPTFNQANCEAQGGTWGRFGTYEGNICRLATRDGGRPCMDSSQCESACFTDQTLEKNVKVSGKCFEWSDTRGACLNRVQRGKSIGVSCD